MINPENMTITVRIKIIEGEFWVFPNCPTSEIFRDLGGKKTISPCNLERIKERGYKVRVDSIL